MKNKLLILILVITICSCKNDSKNQVKTNIEKVEAKKQLRFSLYNTTDFELKNITIGLPDTVLTYQRLQKNTLTEFTNVTSAYHYGFVRFYDLKNRKYYIQPIDYVGETPFKKGELKFIIKEVDSINQGFTLDFEYKNN